MDGKQRSRSLVIVVMGVSGSGKTTVGRALARAVDGRFHDADDFHSGDSIEKMRSGTALTDADREPWLADLRKAVDGWLEEDGGIHVLACSALTKHARRRLGSDRDSVRLVYLHGSADLVASRMRRREHFMRPELLASQLATLEPPDDALALDVSLPVDELVVRICSEWSL